MAAVDGVQRTIADANPSDGVSAKEWGARLRSFHDEYTYAAAPSADDTINLMTIPAGHMFLYGIVTSTVALGASATLRIGDAVDDDRFRVAATNNAAVPALFGVAPYEFTEDTVIIAKWPVVTSIPSAFTLHVTMVCAQF